MTAPHRLAFHHTPGTGPTIVFLPGYASDMQGTKALALEAWAKRTGRAFLRFDYAGCGQSEGAFEDQTLVGWRGDVLAMLDQVATGPVVLVGSSMGGWLMLLAAVARPEQVVGLVGIAPAPDFTDWGFSTDEKMALLSAGRLERPNPYGPEPTVYTRAFWSSGEASRITFGEIAYDGPVRLLHGMRDTDVPWHRATHLAGILRSADVQLTLIKDGDHRLSRDTDLALLIRAVEELCPVLILLALLQAAPTATAARFDACVALTRTDPAAARAEAVRWSASGGRWFARQCAGLAHAAERAWPAAAAEFEAAARAAEAARDTRAAQYWAQAGNAWLAGGDAPKARFALDAALAPGTLPTFERGEALLDRARALVAANEPAAARADLDLALIAVPQDPLAWLLSATLARRVKDTARARKDVAEALRRSPDDASVRLEAGNIAAQAGDEAGARAAWALAARLAPAAPAGQQALAALKQFDGTAQPVKPATPIGR